jgi:hypothetical protein
MKFTALPALIWLAIAALVVVGLVWTSREGFVVDRAFDQSQTQRAVSLEDSSYTQQTNHFAPASSGAQNIPGVPSQHQVNQFQAFVV